MADSKVIIVSEDDRFITNCRQFVASYGVAVTVVSPSEWQSMKGTSNLPHLSLGAQPVKSESMGLAGSRDLSREYGSNVISFQPNPQAKQVATMNELESEAIKNAIFEFRGNLTEAANALGIGRATLYRKIKQYSINPNDARRRRLAKVS